MKLIYAKESLESCFTKPSIFLAGPTTRSPDVPSWRPKAIKLLKSLKYNGYVLIPEDRSGIFKGSYEDQIEWEEKGLTEATAILFWIPRDMQTMPGLTTNDKWGVWKKSGKVVLGVPRTARKCKYQIYYAKKYKVPFSISLKQTVANAILKANALFEAPIPFF